MKPSIFQCLLFAPLLAAFSSYSQATELKLMDSAPMFKAQTHEGKEFDLASRKGHWTVLYFYPKAETPGCTKQACAFRDNLEQIRKEGAEIFGISTDTVEAQKAFHKNQKLNFTLLADPDASITEKYGAKMLAVKIAKRWTFILDPSLRIRYINRDVDPVQDAKVVADQLKLLKK